MRDLEFEPWEPEESVGKLWHVFASSLDAPRQHAAASVRLDDMRGRLGVLFRGLGGARDVEIKASAPQVSHHRLSWRRALGATAEAVARTSFDGEVLRLPEELALLDTAEKNEALYIWIAAAAVHAGHSRSEQDPLRADIRALQAAARTTRDTLSACPGLRTLHTGLRSEVLAARRDRRLPHVEAAVEVATRHLLGGPPPVESLAWAISVAVHREAADLSQFVAPRGYRPFEPVVMWPDVREKRCRVPGDQNEGENHEAEAPGAEANEKTLRAARKNADEAARKDSLVLHKFEAILSWTEFLNLNRRVEDDDEDAAKKAADDQEELALTKVPQRARTRLKLHLDLAPEDVELERLAGKHVYPEWDHRARAYLPAYCRVLAMDAPPAETTPAFLECAMTRRRIRRVRRQFEALRPKRIHLARQIDGEELDIEGVIASRVDLIATGEHDDRVYRASRNQDRDLGVSILLDSSRSTESAVAERQVIDIEREALIALAWGLDACGDDTAIHAFSSLRRDRVYVQRVKDFAEPMGTGVEARIAGLRPGFYTRLGAAIRHVSRELAGHPRQRRLLLVITDGKPNDLDHYEGRHGVEDSHMAVRESRRRGQSVFGVTIDTKAQASFARIFGRGGFAVIPEPEKLTTALPQIYRHLVSG
ncbi:MAG: nitric oxide reductase D protein [Hyphomicrobiaceae bacterium]|nr:nitric oxide reductase D protein [Hyphomicrobiaceae bacterium]